MGTRRKRRHAAAAAVAALAVLLVGCTSNDKTTTSSGTTAPAGDTTGPAPGVTAGTVKIGVTYVDASALTKVGLKYDLGDHKAVYKALIDDINAKGGIAGRKLELSFAPVDPTSSQAADSACVKLTEDDDVFLVTGFFLNDAVLCAVDTHATAVVGGAMTAERLSRAKAPWFAWLPDDQQPEQITQAFGTAGDLKGRVAVFADSRDEDEMKKRVLPALDHLGVNPVATGIVTAPANDTAALQSEIGVIGERFKAAKADTIVLVGASGSEWPQYMKNDPYRPRLLFLSLIGARAFATNAATTDTSLLKGALAGGTYGPDQQIFDEATMQKCVAVLKKAGIDLAPPSASKDKSDQPYQAAFQACPDVALVKALLEKAGKKLNYGTLRAAGNGLKVTIPGDPSARTYGPPPAADGNPHEYLFAWNEAKKDFEMTGKG